MKSELESLKNVGPKVACLLQVAGIETTEQFFQLGAVEATKRMFIANEMSPHIMYFYALVAAEQKRHIFSFDAAEKAELKIEYQDIVAEIGHGGRR